jgi:hypothetical protein
MHRSVCMFTTHSTSTNTCLFKCLNKCCTCNKYKCLFLLDMNGMKWIIRPRRQYAHCNLCPTSLARSPNHLCFTLLAPVGCHLLTAEIDVFQFSDISRCFLVILPCCRLNCFLINAIAREWSSLQTVVHTDSYCATVIARNNVHDCTVYRVSFEDFYSYSARNCIRVGITL